MSKNRPNRVRASHEGPTTSHHLTTPCSCSGNNENCFRCGGWGYIDVIGKGRSSTGQAGTASPQTIAQSTNRRRAKAEKASASPKKQRLLLLCPICGASVRRLAKHTTKVHGFIGPPKPPPPPQPKPQFVDCQKCKCQLRENKLARHMNIVHGAAKLARGAPKEHRQNAALPLTPKSPHRREKLGTVSTVVNPDKQLDATRRYAHPYREQGKFGSHPSHDSFDDESQP